MNERDHAETARRARALLKLEVARGQETTKGDSR